MAPPGISVLMTTYNSERYVAESIESVLNQTFSDFELIINDDHSRDSTLGIAQRYARLDPRIRVSVNDRNYGDYANRRLTAALARGRFLKYHDSDDVMYRHCLAAMVEPLDAEPRAAFALSGPRFWPGGACPMLLTPALAYEREYLGSGLFYLGPPSALFRADAFRELGGFGDEPFSSDFLFWLRACARVNVLLVAGDLFYYRIHPDQQLSHPGNAAAIARAASIEWEMLNSAECPLSEDACEQAKRNVTVSLLRAGFRHARRGAWGTAWVTVHGPRLGASAWLRYLRRPRRSATAGTPPPKPCP